jgi:hypothetical protein
LKKNNKSFAKFETGVFHPVNKEKYKGTLPITYRSSWEKHAFYWCDRNTACVSWGSESTVVHYEHKGGRHRYFIDLTATFKTKDGLKKFLIEIKPHKQTVPPQDSPRKKKRTLLMEQAAYSKNQAKWNAARQYAHRKGMEFVILTEKQLFKS